MTWFFFLNFLRWQVTILWSHWCSLFQTLVDSVHGFQSQGGSIIARTLLSLAHNDPQSTLNSQAKTWYQFYSLVQWGYCYRDCPMSLLELAEAEFESRTSRPKARRSTDSSFHVCHYFLRINGTQLVTNTDVIANTNAQAQCEWTLILNVDVFARIMYMLAFQCHFNYKITIPFSYRKCHHRNTTHSHNTL